MDAKVNNGVAEVAVDHPKETHVKQDAPSKKSAKELRKVDDKSVEQVLKALSSLQTPDEKLAAMCKKYTEIVDENRRSNTTTKQWEKKYVLAQREKEQLQMEYNRTVLLKVKLESLCRELQKQNKSVKDESLLKIREEEERRKETQAKFQNTLTEITTLMQQNYEKNTKLRDDNIDMTKKFKSVVEQYELREQQVDKMAKQMSLESQLSEAKLNKANLEAQADREKLLTEKKQLLLELSQYQARCTEMQATEVALRCQVSMYTDKYDEFQNALTKSNEVFGGFKGEMEKMSKKILKLEKETTMWKQRWEKSHSALLDMAAEKQQRDVSSAHQSRQLQQLQKLCRTLQAERTSLLGVLKDNNIERPQLPQLPPEPEVPAVETVDRVDAMATYCTQLKQSLSQLQGQLDVLTSKNGSPEECLPKVQEKSKTPELTSASKNKAKKGKGKKSKQNDPKESLKNSETTEETFGDCDNSLVDTLKIVDIGESPITVELTETIKNVAPTNPIEVSETAVHLDLSENKLTECVDPKTLEKTTLDSKKKNKNAVGKKASESLQNVNSKIETKPVPAVSPVVELPIETKIEATPAADNKEEVAPLAIDTIVDSLSVTSADSVIDAKPVVETKMEATPMQSVVVDTKVEALPAQTEGVDSKIDALPANPVVVDTKVESSPVKPVVVDIKVDATLAETVVADSKVKILPEKPVVIDAKIEVIPVEIVVVDSKVEAAPAKPVVVDTQVESTPIVKSIVVDTKVDASPSKHAKTAKHNKSNKSVLVESKKETKAEATPAVVDFQVDATSAKTVGDTAKVEETPSVMNSKIGATPPKPKTLDNNIECTSDKPVSIATKVEASSAKSITADTKEDVMAVKAEISVNRTPTTTITNPELSIINKDNADSTVTSSINVEESNKINVPDKKQSKSSPKKKKGDKSPKIVKPDSPNANLPPSPIPDANDISTPFTNECPAASNESSNSSNNETCKAKPKGKSSPKAKTAAKQSGNSTSASEVIHCEMNPLTP